MVMSTRRTRLAWAIVYGLAICAVALGVTVVEHLT